jgi:hypothetical protein
LLSPLVTGYRLNAKCVLLRQMELAMELGVTREEARMFINEDQAASDTFR